MYAESTRPTAKREVQKERSGKRDVQKFRSAQREDRILRSAKRDDRIARPRRAQTCELRAMRMCPRSGQIFFYTKMKIWYWLVPIASLYGRKVVKVILLNSDD